MAKATTHKAWNREPEATTHKSSGGDPEAPAQKAWSGDPKAATRKAWSREAEETTHRGCRTYKQRCGIEPRYASALCAQGRFAIHGVT